MGGEEVLQRGEGGALAAGGEGQPQFGEARTFGDDQPEQPQHLRAAQMHQQFAGKGVQHLGGRAVQRQAAAVGFLQTGVKPPTFVLFVSHARGVHFSYERYLMNAIRSEFGFDKVPIRLIFRKKR